ncbi:MAG TPA: hypothetical protein VK427_07260, partial [Kofleriaceae bacterium]|nr:hypothetical protein [Kofleriaceae bacterium]
VTTYAPVGGGERLRVIELRSQAEPGMLLRRSVRGGWDVRRTHAIGDLVVDELASSAGYHVGLGIRDATDNPDAVVRTPVLIASCLGPTTPKSACRRSLARAVDAATDEADGSWLYTYFALLGFATLVIGRRLQIPRRLLPPKPSGRLPVARLR